MLLFVQFNMFLRVQTEKKRMQTSGWIKRIKDPNYVMLLQIVSPFFSPMALSFETFLI